MTPEDQRLANLNYLFLGWALNLFAIVLNILYGDKAGISFGILGLFFAWLLMDFLIRGNKWQWALNHAATAAVVLSYLFWLI